MQNQELAGRWTRLGAAVIDGILAIVVTLPLFSFFGVWDQVVQGGMIPLSTSILLSLVGIVLFLLVHGYFLANYGQTIGKKLLDIKIVDLDGNKPEFISLIAKRYVPVWLITQIPYIGGLFGIVDALFIFRKDRRCIHDMIAGTRVVENTTISFNKKTSSVEKSAENPF